MKAIKNSIAIFLIACCMGMECESILLQLGLTFIFSAIAFLLVVPTVEHE